MLDSFLAMYRQFEDTLRRIRLEPLVKGIYGSSMGHITNVPLSTCSSVLYNISRVRTGMDKHLTWNQKLKHERKLRGLTQKDVAALVGSESKTVGRWERGEAFPSPYNRRKLIELYGKNAEELGLLKEEGNGNSEESESISGYIDG